jgi:hypothetical protein
MRGSLAWLLLMPSLVGGISAVHAQGAKIDRAEITEAGIYRAETISIEQAPDTATRQRNVLSNTRLVAATTRVEAKLGVHFGIRYRLVGSPNNTTVRLTSVTQYPAPGLKNPKADGNQLRGEHSLFATIGHVNYRGYMFEQDWEIVPGAWTFELWDGKRKLISQTFDVIKP